MDLSGKQTFEVPRTTLWEYLMDPEVLAKITPGISDLETVGDNKFKTRSTIKIGPVKGTFKGKLSVTDQVVPESFNINMEQLSSIGNAHVDIHMILKSIGETQTELGFEGKAKLSGVIARTGQRVLSGVAGSITKDVFAALETHIRDNAAPGEISEPVQSLNEKTGASFWDSLLAFIKRIFGG